MLNLTNTLANCVFNISVHAVNSDLIHQTFINPGSHLLACRFWIIKTLFSLQQNSDDRLQMNRYILQHPEKPFHCFSTALLTCDSILIRQSNNGWTHWTQSLLMAMAYRRHHYKFNTTAENALIDLDIHRFSHSTNLSRIQLHSMCYIIQSTTPFMIQVLLNPISSISEPAAQHDFNIFHNSSIQCLLNNCAFYKIDSPSRCANAFHNV